MNRAAGAGPSGDPSRQGEERTVGEYRSVSGPPPVISRRSAGGPVVPSVATGGGARSSRSGVQRGEVGASASTRAVGPHSTPTVEPPTHRVDRPATGASAETTRRSGRVLILGHERRLGLGSLGYRVAKAPVPSVRGIVSVVSLSHSFGLFRAGNPATGSRVGTSGSRIPGPTHHDGGSRGARRGPTTLSRGRHFLR